MSRLVSLTLAATSAVALATVTSPAPAPVHAPQPAAVTAGVSGDRVGGSWCC